MSTPDLAEVPLLPSERKFGMLFFIILAALAAYQYIAKDRRVITYILAALALAFLMSTLLMPAVLRPLNVLWFKLGLLMGKVVNPIVMGIMFFLLITPIAFIVRLMGRDELKLKLNPNAQSYWVDREPKGPAPDSFNNQF